MEKRLPSIEDFEAFVGRIEFHILRGEWDAVRRTAEDRLDLIPGDGAACLALSLSMAREGRKKEALRVLENMERIEEGWGLLYRYGGDVFARQGMIREAMESYRKSSILNSGKVRWIERNGSAAPEPDAVPERRPREEDEGGKVPEEFLTPTMADLYVRQGHYELARSSLEKLLSGDPGNEALREKLRNLEVRIEERRTGRERILSELNRWLSLLEERRAAAAGEGLHV
jgi:tetratricopeptide (TPR) repeat protein